MRSHSWLLTLVAALTFAPVVACGSGDYAPSPFGAQPGMGEDQEDFGEDSEEGEDPFESETLDEIAGDDLSEPEEDGGIIDDEVGEDPAEEAEDGSYEDDYEEEGAEEGNGVTATRGPRQFKVMTYNVRRQAAGDVGGYTWAKRKDDIVARIIANKPDIVGLQEASGAAAGDLIAGLAGPGKIYGVYRPSKAGSPKLVFFRKSKFIVDAKAGRGNRKLPNPYGQGDACFPNAKNRRAAWFGLKERTSKQVFLIVNAHLTHSAKCGKGREAQAEDIKKLIASKRKESHVILMGDFNTDPQAAETRNETTIRTLESMGVQRTASYSGTTGKTEATFNSNWKKKGWKTSARLDWIFQSGGDITSQSPVIDRTKMDGITPSDHFPVLATIRGRK